jgi:uncharacterized protein YycO
MTALRVIYTRSRSLGSVLIRAGAWWGPWSHCGLVDGAAVIECLALKGGVVCTPLAEVLERSSEWQMVEIPCPQPALGLEWARSTVGEPYDWLGVFAIPARARDWQAPGRWYCSEHVEAALARAGADRWRSGLHGISPCASFYNKGA